MTEHEFQNAVLKQLKSLNDNFDGKIGNLKMYMENEIADKIKALFDDREINRENFRKLNEGQARIEEELSVISLRLSAVERKVI